MNRGRQVGLFLVMLLILSLTVIACGKKEAASPTAAPTATATPAPSPTPTTQARSEGQASTQVAKPPAEVQEVLGKVEQAMGKVKTVHLDVKASMEPGNLAIMEQTFDIQTGAGALVKFVIKDPQTGKTTTEMQMLIKGEDVYLMQSDQTKWEKAPAPMTEQIKQSMGQFKQFGIPGTLSTWAPSFDPLAGIAVAWEKPVDEALDRAATQKIGYTLSQEALAGILSSVLPKEAGSQDMLKGMQIEGKGNLWVSKADSLLRRALISQSINIPGMGSKISINVDARFSDYDKPITLPNP